MPGTKIKVIQRKMISEELKNDLKIKMGSDERWYGKMGMDACLLTVDVKSLLYDKDKSIVVIFICR